MENNDISNLLNKWEETYKKGLLSFWILLLYMNVLPILMK
jgi:hypothetical protein